MVCENFWCSYTNQPPGAVYNMTEHSQTDWQQEQLVEGLRENTGLF